MGNQRATQTKATEATSQRKSATVTKPPLTRRTAVHPMLQLQRTVGNRAVNQLIERQRMTQETGVSKTSVPIQAKLTIGEPGDKYEQEADRVATQVVNQIQAPASQPSASEPSVQRMEMTEEEDEQLMTKPMVQRLSAEGGMGVPPDLEASLQRAKGGGQPLAESVREPMEQAFGADFSGVKVHADAKSDQLNQSIQAKAFTTGQDVFFRSGAYEPGSRGGQELLAHELTHVVQQNGGAVQRRIEKQPESKDNIQTQSAKSLSEGIVELSVDHTYSRIQADFIEQVVGDEQERRSNYGFNANGQWQGENRGLNFQGNQTFSGVAQVQQVAITANNQTLRGRIYTPVNGVTNNTTVIILSGSHGASEEYTQPIAENYCRDGSQVVAINYRGFGGSTAANFQGGGNPNAGIDLSEDALYDDAEAILDWTINNQQVAANNILVHGYSLGGPIATELVRRAEMNGIHVKGLVLDRAMTSARAAGAAHMGAASSALKYTGLARLAGFITKKLAGRFSVKDKLQELARLRFTLPIIITSAGPNDVLSAEDRKLATKAQNFGFSNLVHVAQNQATHFDHDQIYQAARQDLQHLL